MDPSQRRRIEMRNPCVMIGSLSEYYFAMKYFHVIRLAILDLAVCQANRVDTSRL